MAAVSKVAAVSKCAMSGRCFMNFHPEIHEGRVKTYNTSAWIWRISQIHCGTLENRALDARVCEFSAEGVAVGLRCWGAKDLLHCRIVDDMGVYRVACEDDVGVVIKFFASDEVDHGGASQLKVFPREAIHLYESLMQRQLLTFGERAFQARFGR